MASNWNADIIGNKSSLHRLSRSPWTAVLFLAPFLLMLSVHRLLGLSDALLVASGPGERDAHEFNLVMVVVLYLGIGAACHHLTVTSHRRPGWIIAKLLVLGALVCVGFLT